MDAKPKQMTRRERGIFERNGRFLVFVYAGKKSTYVGAADTLTAARQLREEHSVVTRRRVAEGKAPTPDHTQTFATYATDWLARKKPTMKASTFRSTTAVVTATLVPTFGTRPLKQLTTAVLEDGFTTLRRKDGRPFTPKSLRNIAQVLREVLGDAVRRDALAAVPVFALPIRSEEAKPKPLSIPDPAVIAQVIAAMPSPYKEAATLAACTGIREGELLALTWDAITDAGLAITTARDQSGVATTPKSAAGHRVVPLPPEVRAFLAAWKQRQSPPSPYLFPVAAVGSYRKKGTTENVRNPARLPVLDDAKFRKVFQDACATLGVTARIHDLRHVFASQVIATGGHASLPLLAACLGHSSPAFTLKQYTHLFANAPPTLLAGVVAGYSSLLPDAPIQQSSAKPNKRKREVAAQ